MAVVEIDAAYAEALDGIDDCESVVVLCWFHRSRRDLLRVHPRGDEGNPLRGVFATRSPEKSNLEELAPLIEYGASTRASIYLCQAAQALAFLKGRGFVTPQDVKDISLDVLRHRVLLTYEAEAEEVTPDDVIEKVLAHVPVP